MCRVTETTCQKSNVGHTGNIIYFITQASSKAVFADDKRQYSWVSWHLEKAIRMAIPNRNFETQYHKHKLIFFVYCHINSHVRNCSKTWNLFCIDLMAEKSFSNMVEGTIF